MENTNESATPFTLQGEPAGFGTLPMGCLDHAGYTMSNEKDFYSKFILELVPNNAHDDAWYVRNLKPVQPMQPRIDTRLFNAAFRNAINAPDRMNVMYSHDSLARGRVSRLDEVSVPTDNAAFVEARAMRYEGQVRPRLISFLLPGKPEKYLWIDLSWPIRNILLPISQVSYPGEKPNCTYTQINFRRLRGRLAVSGWAEDGNQGFVNWEGDNRRGLVWNGSAASMRIDLELLSLLLTLPRHMRKPDFNVLAALQLHRWDVGVPYNPRLPMNSNGHFVSDTGKFVSNYPLVSGFTARRSTVGVAFDKFLSDINGVQLVFPPPPQNRMVSILNTVLSVGLSFIPVAGPLLAIASPLIIRAIEDPDSVSIRNLLTIEFGIELAGAILGSAQSYQGLKNPTATTLDVDETVKMPPPLYYGESPDDYKLNPNNMDPTEEEKEMAKKDPEKKNDSVEPETS
jgi:hypothetical protein